MPPEMADGETGEHRRINRGGEQEGEQLQFHLRVIGPHPMHSREYGKAYPNPWAVTISPAMPPTRPKATGGAKARILRLK